MTLDGRNKWRVLRGQRLQPGYLPGARTVLATPLLREGVPIGAILVRRKKFGRFQKNRSRFLKPCRPGRDRDGICICSGACKLETATLRRGSRAARAATGGQFLKVISAPARRFIYEPVFETLCETATRLCGADTGSHVQARDGERAAVSRLPGRVAAVDRLVSSQNPSPPRRGTLLRRTSCLSAARFT